MIFFGIVSKHGALDLHASPIDESHGEYLGQFVAFTGKLPVWFLYDSYYDFPSSLEVNI